MDIKYQEEHFNFKGNKWEIQDNETMKGCDSKGNSFIIDKDDYNYVKSYCWLRVKGRSSKQGNYFCARESRKNGHKTMMLHNFIWEHHYGKIPYELIIDHIDQNPANNKLNNLRLVNKSQNAINQSVKTNNTSGIIGVSYDNTHHYWRSYLTWDKHRIEFSKSDTKEEAIKKRLQGELQYFGEYAPQKHLFEEYDIW